MPTPAMPRCPYEPRTKADLVGLGSSPQAGAFVIVSPSFALCAPGRIRPDAVTGGRHGAAEPQTAGPSCQRPYGWHVRPQRHLLAAPPARSVSSGEDG